MNPQTQQNYDITKDAITGWELELLTPVKVQHYWDDIEQMLDCVPHTWEMHYSKESFYERAVNGVIQVWAVGSKSNVIAVFFTQVGVFPSGRILQLIWGCGEDMLKAKHLIAARLQMFARDTECVNIEIMGRSGWERILKEFGFKQRAVLLSCPVIKEQKQ